MKPKTKKQIYQELINNREVKCKFCGKTANYQLHKNKNGDVVFCCVEKARQCPEYNSFKKRTHITRIGTPEQIKSWKVNLKLSQNRMDVKAKKSQAMLTMHHDIKYKEFQDKFRMAHQKRRKNYEEFIKE